MARPRFRQVLLSFSRFGDGDRICLEILKVGQKGPRRSGVISGEGRDLALGSFGSNPDTPIGVMLDWLADYPEQIQGLRPADVMAAVEAVRERGGWFVSPLNHPRRVS